MVGPHKTCTAYLDLAAALQSSLLGAVDTEQSIRVVARVQVLCHQRAQKRVWSNLSRCWL